MYKCGDVPEESGVIAPATRSRAVSCELLGTDDLQASLQPFLEKALSSVSRGGND